MFIADSAIPHSGTHLTLIRRCNMALQVPIEPAPNASGSAAHHRSAGGLVPIAPATTLVVVPDNRNIQTVSEFLVTVLGTMHV